MYLYEVSENSKTKFYESFNRTEEMLNNDIDTIKTWIKSQPHLPEIMEDVKIKNFLHLNKFSIENTKQKIDMYYTLRTVVPEIFEKSNPKLEYLKEFFEKTYLFLFPKLLDDKHRIFYFKPKRPNEFDPIMATSVSFALFETRLYEDFMMDDVIVVDWGNLTVNDMTRLTPTTFSKFFTTYKKVYNLRVKRIIYINCTSYISVLVACVKAVVSSKMFGRLEVYKNDSVLKEILPKDLLPKDYGGDGLSLDETNENAYRKLLEYQDRFDKLDTLKVDETLRPGKLNNDEILGFYGNFKKVDVD